MGTNEVEIQCTKNSLFRLSAWPVLPALKVVCAYKFLDSEEKETKEESTTVFGDIRPEEIPEVPSQKFLFRGDVQPKER
jgi:hypothetical protein